MVSAYRLPSTWVGMLSDQHTLQTAQLIGVVGLAWAGLELLCHLVCTPYFMHLLEGNPKLAGQQAKKASAATQMCPRLVCFVHNILQIPLAVAILADPLFYRDTIWGRTEFSTLVMAISAGYFLYDSLECAFRIQHEGWDFLLHGVFCFLVFSNLTYTGYMHFYGAGFLLWELSTPMLHFRWVLYKIGKGDTKLYKYNALAGMATFFACRILWGNALSLMFWFASYRALRTPRGAELPMSAIWFYRLSTFVMNGLNAWWFTKMVAILQEALAAKKQRQQAAGANGSSSDGSKPKAA